MQRKINHTFILIFILSLSTRIILFHSLWGDRRHSTAKIIGSVAIGFYHGEGITYQISEIDNINKIKSNSSGNYLNYFTREGRQNLIQYLPGPSILLSLLWKIIPCYNFSPYIYLQIIIDSILIAFFYIFFKKISGSIICATALLMASNPIVISKSVLIMGYDFWPNFCVLINFIGIWIYLRNYNHFSILLLVGFLSALTIWFRSITSFLPFLITFLILYYLKSSEKLSLKKAIIAVSYYILPVIISILLLSVFRYNQTGNYRPTRSTFWHAFMTGVGQFSNPYNLVSDDEVIRNFARKLNEDLKTASYAEMHYSSNSQYEATLKKEAIHFITQYPQIFVRNIVYRIGIMISPTLFKGWGALPKQLIPFLFPIGFIILLVWFLGMYTLFENHKLLFFLSLTIYLYFFAMFSWFYIVARVIYPFLFINVFVYLFGIKYTGQLVKQKILITTKFG
ncbi:MAG: hypothetical protein H8E13_00105 [Actinobacteria bacterium]|nr:hypothetical protein [Actinomycetota bacterium]